ncbi:MAG: hypothetical protein AB1578_05480 [Thermodesulfobacteriota bacterium]
MAAKANESSAPIDLSAYDFFGRGGLDPANLINVTPCGACHPGGGLGEYARNPDGTRGSLRYDELDEAAQPAFDGDFWTLNGPAAGKSRWSRSGVVEADCLLCHLPGYSFSGRWSQLTYRNFQWAPTVGAGLGTVSGRVYSYDYNATPQIPFARGVWNDGDPLPTVDYSKAAPGRFTAQGKLSGALIQTRPPEANCMFCHGPSDRRKRGFDWNAAKDVHKNGSVHCLDCHGMAQEPLDHQIGKGYEGVGTVRDDLDGTMAYGVNPCAHCHFGGPVEDEAAQVAAAKAVHGAYFGEATFHLDAISCEGCHIPSIQDNMGYLIDMSSGQQIWMFRDGKTQAWPPDVNQITPGLTWRPFLKKYDPDGPGGPRPQRYYPYGAKTSVWLGILHDNGEVQPIILRHVSAAYAAIQASPTPFLRPAVPVDLVTGGAATRPSVSEPEDIRKLLVQLKHKGVAPGATHPTYPAPVYVGETVLGLDDAENLVEVPGAHGESDHNFSINHNVAPAARALGAGGCADCHRPGEGPLANPQIRDATRFLATRNIGANGLLDPAAEAATGETILRAAGFSAEEETRLLGTVAADRAETIHAAIVSYAAQGANTCAQCHPGEVEAFRDTVHYASRSVVENENFFFPGGGKHGMLDRACALVGSNMLLNMITTGYDSTATAAAEGGAPAQQCGSCHTNYYNTLMEGFIALQAGPEVARALMLSGTDCLVCHAEHYDYDLRRTLEDDPLGPMSPNLGFGTVNGRPQRIRQDRSGEALASIVRTPTDHMCLRCHEHGRTDYKRGELPDAAFDAHYASRSFEGNPCLECHEARDHKFNRGAMVNGDIFASDYPVNGPDNDTSCLKCHTAPVIHRNARIEEHLGALACETCHIPWTSGAATTVWADGGFLALAKGGADNRPVQLYTKKEGNQSDSTNEQLWNRYKQRPIYMPFSGLTTFLAQSLPVPNPNTGAAPKIWPFKTIINPLPFDGRFFGIGLPAGQSPMGPDGVNVYSMFAAMRMFADQYKALGFMDADFDFSKFAVDPVTGMVGTTVTPDAPRYPSYAAMAQMAQFPNLLFFDKYTFGYNWYQDLGKLDAAGKIVRWDEEGPLARPLAVKDLRKAVEVGMGRLLDMMLQMGFDPSAYGMTAAQMKGMYSTAGLSADQLVVMAAPPGSEVQAMLAQMGGVNPLIVQNYPAWSNGVTLGGHGVSRADALFCADCHDPDRSVFAQKVEVPDYGPSGMPLFHWEFYSRELLAKAEAGQFVADVWADGYALRSASFEMGSAFVTASQAAASFSPPVTSGVEGEYLAVLTPTTRLATNWEVLGYSPRRIAELTGVSSDGDPSVPGDVGSSRSGSSECFVQALGAAAPSAGWLAAGLLAALGLALRRK